MDTFNYNHLFYFWAVARNGSVSRASAELRVSQPTVSEQIGKLEEALGVNLFERAGRGIRLSEPGLKMFSYADRIFRLGQEMREVMERGAPATTVTVGATSAVPDLLALDLVGPILRDERTRLTLVQDRWEALLAKLALRQVDLVLCDTPVSRNAGVRAFSQRMLATGTSFVASPRLRLKGKFPQMLEGAPFLMPEASAKARDLLEKWFEKSSIRPKVAGEFSDFSMMQTFAREGLGVLAVPTTLEREMRLRFRLSVLGRTKAIAQEFWAVTADRKPENAAVKSILNVMQERGQQA
ncbi:MAG TPA: LysR family transcriptional regulator [Candidatus Acidoferrales bacterium]|nr:LysR family transcriptional regulator [Candidatus Acidoferrales bacterium]